MKNFLVEYTAAENNYDYSGTWADEIVEAETADEAIDLLAQHCIENDVDPSIYIYRVRNGSDIIAIG